MLVKGFRFWPAGHIGEHFPVAEFKVWPDGHPT